MVKHHQRLLACQKLTITFNTVSSLSHLIQLITNSTFIQVNCFVWVVVIRIILCSVSNYTMYVVVSNCQYICCFICQYFKCYKSLKEYGDGIIVNSNIQPLCQSQKHQTCTDSVHSVKPCISGNLSVGSVTLYKSVWHCIGKGWFADVDHLNELC